MIRLLDTREQKSPRFLMDAFPDLQITVMESGDYFSGKKVYSWDNLTTSAEEVHFDELKMPHRLEGNLVEIKIGSDFGIHTEPLERFQDELYRMSCYRQKNPHVQLHAVWMPDRIISNKEAKQWGNYCYKYHVWGHIIYYRKYSDCYHAGNIDNQQRKLIQLLKDLDTAKYSEFEPYLKRSHEEPTILAKMLRQFPGISSQKAIDLAKIMGKLPTETYFDEHDYEGGAANEFKMNVFRCIGLKKNGDPKKLALDFIHWLETGETR